MRLQCAGSSPGGVPERPKGTGCKPVGSAYGGSNPPAPTPLYPSRNRCVCTSFARARGYGMTKVAAALTSVEELARVCAWTVMRAVAPLPAF